MNTFLGNQPQGGWENTPLGRKQEWNSGFLQDKRLEKIKLLIVLDVHHPKTPGGVWTGAVKRGEHGGAEYRVVLCSAPSVPQPDFTITEKAPTRDFSWLKAPTSAFTFKTLLRHYAKRALTQR